MKTRISCHPVFPWLRVTILAIAVTLCFTGMSRARAENEAPDPDRSEAVSSQKTTVAVTQPLDEKALMSSIGTLMDDKLAPLYQKQAKLEKLLLEDKFSGPKMTDIVGGIGWILGLGGIAAFFLSFKRKPRK
jgi:nickel transport protein